MIIFMMLHADGISPFPSFCLRGRSEDKVEDSCLRDALWDRDLSVAIQHPCRAMT